MSIKTTITRPVELGQPAPQFIVTSILGGIQGATGTVTPELEALLAQTQALANSAQQNAAASETNKNQTAADALAVSEDRTQTGLDVQRAEVSAQNAAVSAAAALTSAETATDSASSAAAASAQTQLVLTAVQQFEVSAQSYAQAASTNATNAAASAVSAEASSVEASTSATEAITANEAAQQAYADAQEAFTAAQQASIDAADASRLTIGTVTTATPGSSAQATITGAAGSQSLNLTIPAGLKGDKGDKGDTGPQGVKGDTGATGPQGLQGIQGETGPKGDKGDKGDTGDTGPGLSIKGTLANSGLLPATGEMGDGYLISGDLWVWAGAAWTNTGNIQGPQGEQGPQGIQGPVGPQGPKGDAGEQGPQGAGITTVTDNGDGTITINYGSGESVLVDFGNFGIGRDLNPLPSWDHIVPGKYYYVFPTTGWTAVVDISKVPSGAVLQTYLEWKHEENSGVWMWSRYYNPITTTFSGWFRFSLGVANWFLDNVELRRWSSRTRHLHQLRPVSTETDVDLALSPLGSGAIQATNGGDVRGLYAVDLQTYRSAVTQVASGESSALLGGYNNTASGDNAVVVGGALNKAETLNSALVGGTANTVTWGTSSGIFAGGGNTVSEGDAVICGGNTNQALAMGSFIGGGWGHLAEGSYSAAVGGFQNKTAYGSFAGGGSGNLLEFDYSSAVGSKQAKTFCKNMQVFSGGMFAEAGDAQTFRVITRRALSASSDLFSLTLDGNSPTSANDLFLPDNHVAYVEFRGMLVTQDGRAASFGRRRTFIRVAGTTRVLTATTMWTHDETTPILVLSYMSTGANGRIAVGVNGVADSPSRAICEIRGLLVKLPSA